MERRRYVELAVSTGSLFLLAQALFGAFSFETREKIRQRDRVSVESGSSRNLECAHWNHNRNNPKYNDPENGRLLTAREHYLDHWYRRDNGLSDERNEEAVFSIWERLSKRDRKGLPHPNNYNKKARTGR